MFSLLFVLIKILRLILTVLQVMMMVRAVISWLPIDEDSSVANFVYVMTEPLVYPIRVLFERFDKLNDLPIDMSFIAAFMLLSFVRMLIPAV